MRLKARRNVKNYNEESNCRPYWILYVSTNENALSQNISLDQMTKSMDLGASLKAFKNA